MKDLIKYLTKHSFSFETYDDERLVTIGGKSFYILQSDEDGNIFNDEFKIDRDLDSRLEFDHYLFKFGGRYYYTPRGSEKNPELNRLRYFGNAEIMIHPLPFLGIHGGFEILSGSRNYKDWVKKANYLNIDVLGICEKNTLAGVLKFQSACKAKNIRPIIGASYSIMKPDMVTKYQVKVYVKDEIGWRSILEINKQVKVVNEGFIPEDLFLTLLDGLVTVIDPKYTKFELVPNMLLKSYYQLDTVTYSEEGRDREYLLNLQKFYKSGFEPIAIFDAYYLEQEDHPIMEILSGISGTHDFESENQYFKSYDEYYLELFNLFSNETTFESTEDRATKNLYQVVDECRFNIDVSNRFLPKYIMTEDQKSRFGSNEDLFWHLIQKGLEERYGENITDEHLQRIEIEVDVIQYGDVIDYFLTLWNIVEWCRGNDILVGFGRGSAAGALTSYILGITQLDPLKFDLLFERFLNKGRVLVSLPDIDVDFESSRRDEVKSYMESKYGVTQVCSVGTYTNLKLKSAIKDVGKQFNATFDETNDVTKLLDEESNNLSEFFRLSTKYKSIRNFINKYPGVINSIELLLGQPKASSIHACATMIFPSEKEMYNWVPVKRMFKDSEQIIVTEWEGDELADAGFLKEDILGISELDKFKSILKSVKLATGKSIDIYKIPLDDKKVYKYFQNGWNSEVFHFGSQGLTQYCKALQPENIDDLVAGISLYRPGAMENNFHNEYVLRKNGDKPVEYFTGSEEVLDKTYGVFVYQEQIMKLCQVLGGLSLVEADDVRKAMVKKKYEALHQYKERFIPNYVKQFGVTEEYSAEVWDAIDKASTYLFNRSHAAAYSVTGYVGQWLKVHYPIHFWTVALQHASSTQDKEERIPRYLSEINKTGSIRIGGIDINYSELKFSHDIDRNRILFSLTVVKFVGESAVNQIIEDRNVKGEYFDFEEFYRRHKYTGSKVTKRVIENLILSGAFDKIEDVKEPRERYHILQKFHVLHGIKEKDIDPIYQQNKSSDVWWTLQQKALSGIGIFDFDELCGGFDKDLDYMSSSNLLESRNKNKSIVTGGVVVNIIQKQGKRGEYANIILEQNFELFEVKFWPEQWVDFKEIVNTSAGNVVILSGKIGYDNYKKENVLYVTESTDLKVLR